MATGHLGQLLGQLRQLLGTAAPVSTDGELLQRFVVEHDQAGFAALVERYAGLVHGVCRRVLPVEQDAEDAFQATFLVLLRKAASLDGRGSIAGWLHTVAQRTALKARTRAGRRQAHERQVAVVAETMPDDAATRRELGPVLDDEVNRLPARYRQPVVLCYLAGKTNVDAAAELGLSRDMVRRRLAEAAELLRDRLTRRGITVSAIGLAVLLTQSAQAATAPAAWLPALRQGCAGLSPSVVGLAEGVLRDMMLLKFKIAAALVLVASVALASAGVLARRAPEPTTPVAAAAPTDPEAPRPPDQFKLGAPVGFAAVSPDGTLMAAADNAASIVIWDRATGKELHRLRVDDPPDPGEIILNRNASRIPPYTYFAIAPDNRTLAAIAGDDLKSGRTLYVFDLTTGRKLHRSHERGDRVIFAPDGRSFLLWGTEITIWETATRQKRTTLAVPETYVRSIAFSGNGRTLAAVTALSRAGGRTGWIQLWDVAEGKRGAELKVAWDGNTFADVLFSGDGKKLGVVWDRTVVCLDATSGKVLGRADLKHSAPGWSRLPQFAFNRKQTLLAAAVDGSKVSVVNIATRANVAEVTVPGKGVQFAALTADGQILLTADDKGDVQLWPVPAAE